MPRTYEFVHVNRLGHRLTHELVSDDTLEPGAIIRSEGRGWIVDRVEDSRVFLEPARYRLSCATLTAIWRPARSAASGPMRRALATRSARSSTTRRSAGSWSRSVSRVTTTASRSTSSPPTGTTRSATSRRACPSTSWSTPLRVTTISARPRQGLAEAAEAGLPVELVALEPEEAPDWDEGRRCIDALMIEDRGRPAHALRRELGSRSSGDVDRYLAGMNRRASSAVAATSRITGEWEA